MPALAITITTARSNEITRLHELVKGLHHSGVRVLRNQAMALENPQRKTMACRPWRYQCARIATRGRAFAMVPNDAATITLVHNPEAIDYLHQTDTDIIMSGHTHGAIMDGICARQKTSFPGRAF